MRKVCLGICVRTVSATPDPAETDRTQGPRPRPHTVDREAGMRGLVRTLVVLSAVLLVPASSFAQQASIAGVVKDASGAVLPGLSVEATSSVLTEKVRAVVTDGTGQYRIVELPPGTYSVTFTLQGFNVVKREGVGLTGSLHPAN